MDELTKSVGISSLIALGLVAAVMFGPGMFSEEQSFYFCEARAGVGLVSCDNFSKYVDPMGKCIRNQDTNLICREGWKLVVDDRLPDEEISRLDVDYVVAKGNYLCSPSGCEKILGGEN